MRVPRGCKTSLCNKHVPSPYSCKMALLLLEEEENPQRVLEGLSLGWGHVTSFGDRLEMW